MNFFFSSFLASNKEDIPPGAGLNNVKKCFAHLIVRVKIFRGPAHNLTAKFWSWGPKEFCTTCRVPVFFSQKSRHPSVQHSIRTAPSHFPNL